MIELGEFGCGDGGVFGGFAFFGGLIGAHGVVW